MARNHLLKANGIACHDRPLAHFSDEANTFLVGSRSHGIKRLRCDLSDLDILEVDRQFPNRDPGEIDDISCKTSTLFPSRLLPEQ